MSLADAFIRYYNVKPGYALKAKEVQGTPPVSADYWIIYLGKLSFPDATGRLRLQNVFAVSRVGGNTRFIGEGDAVELLHNYYPAQLKMAHSGHHFGAHSMNLVPFLITPYDPGQFNLLTYQCDSLVNQLVSGRSDVLQTNGLKVLVGWVGRILLIGLSAFAIMKMVS